MKAKRVPKGFWEEHDAELRRLAEEENLTSKQVAEKLGVSRDAVSGRATRIGIKWFKPPLFAKSAKKPQAVKEQEVVKNYWIARFGWSFPPSGRCVFPQGDLKNRNFSFCGEPVIQDGRPYCPDHHTRAYYRTNRGV